MAHRAPIVVLTALVALLVLAGCGPLLQEAEPTPTPRPTAAPTPTPVALRSQPAAGRSGGDGTGASPGSEPGLVVAAPLSAVAVVERVRPAVVTVVNEQQAGLFGPDQSLEAGRGTGFIIDEAGHIVTNEHVVRGGDRFEVIFADGEKRPAEVIGADPLSDLAVVRVDGALPAAVSFGDSETLQVGQPVLAIGSPLGEFTGTVTDGIVSALNRDFPGTRGEAAYSNLIQHNAAINPGNSGGPLFDLNGQVIGVNALGIPVTEQGLPAQGLFFAIPANTVQRIVAQLIEAGRVYYPYFGVEFREVSPDLASQAELTVDFGAYVLAVVPGSPAAAAEVRPDDIIVALGDRQINAQTSFTEALFDFRPGDTIEVLIVRGGDEVRLELTLAERP